MEDIIANILLYVIPAILIRRYCVMSYQLKLNGRHSLA
jgi:hypothetical protein